MEESNKDAYSEVIEILKLIDDEKKLEALPIEMLEVLKVKSNPKYKPQISMEIPLDEQNLQKETMSILAWIATKYWSNEINAEDMHSIQRDIQNTDSVIENIEQENGQNTEKLKQEDIQDEIEKVSIEKETSSINTNANMPILYKDLKWYEKIRFKIVEFFNKIFRANKKRKEMEN